MEKQLKKEDINFLFFLLFCQLLKRKFFIWPKCIRNIKIFAWYMSSLVYGCDFRFYILMEFCILFVRPNDLSHFILQYHNPPFTRVTSFFEVIKKKSARSALSKNLEGFTLFQILIKNCQHWKKPSLLKSRRFQSIVFYVYNSLTYKSKEAEQ